MSLPCTHPTERARTGSCVFMFVDDAAFREPTQCTDPPNGSLHSYPRGPKYRRHDFLGAVIKTCGHAKRDHDQIGCRWCGLKKGYGGAPLAYAMHAYTDE